jgi:hypothetical protein
VSERRLSDLVSVGVLTRTFPPGLVDEVIAGCGRTEVRHRALPARVMAYFSVGMALHSEGSYEDVLGLLTDGLAWASGTEPVKLPSKSAIFQARSRLGAEPLQALFARVAAPLAEPGAVGAWLAGRRLVAIDGTCVDVADTPDNAGHFGRPGVNKGEQAAFPQARLVALAECGTHAMFDAVVGPYTTAENTLAGELIDRLEPGMLLLADRGFCGFPLWQRAVATGADLLWRAKPNMKPGALDPVEPDSAEATGDWLLRPCGEGAYALEVVGCTGLVLVVLAELGHEVAGHHEQRRHGLARDVERGGTGLDGAVEVALASRGDGEGGVGLGDTHG